MVTTRRNHEHNSAMTAADRASRPTSEWRSLRSARIRARSRKLVVARVMPQTKGPYWWAFCLVLPARVVAKKKVMKSRAEGNGDYEAREVNAKSLLPARFTGLKSSSKPP
ncbi:hypothetical protein Pyn_36570 [Prunus yedoensis var. nudiflora]|uniref:Uncharacterized protein n=1 Tax=Prunus yedoensis var. nudiflora TaxID=2094558 RepID=A0A314UUV5_PRUYE|nr:hypothetical protein Pyn_36570 [Prunus yedoensis var. nudiflora]